MTLRDVENAQRVEGSTWALGNGLQFLWSSGDAGDVHAQPSLVWSSAVESSERLTSRTLVHTGAVNGAIYVPAGSGVVAALALAESLVALFRGRFYAGSRVLDEATISPAQRDGASYRVDVTIPWEFDEQRIPQGAVGLYQTPGAVVAYQAVRQLWELHVRAPLQLTTFFDNAPSTDTSPPFAFARFRVFSGISVEMRTLRFPGRLLVALHHPLGLGTEAARAAVDAIVQTFTQCNYHGVVFGDPLVNRIGRSPTNTWQTNVRVPFYYDVPT